MNDLNFELLDAATTLYLDALNKALPVQMLDKEQALERIKEGRLFPDIGILDDQEKIDETVRYMIYYTNFVYTHPEQFNVYGTECNIMMIAGGYLEFVSSGDLFRKAFPLSTEKFEEIRSQVEHMREHPYEILLSISKGDTSKYIDDPKKVIDITKETLDILAGELFDYGIEIDTWEDLLDLNLLIDSISKCIM